MRADVDDEKRVTSPPFCEVEVPANMLIAPPTVPVPDEICVREDGNGKMCHVYNMCVLCMYACM